MGWSIRSHCALFGVLMVLAACFARGGAPGDGRPVLLATPTPTVDGTIAFPLDRYLPSAEQVRTLLTAQDRLARACLHRFGVTAKRPVLPVGGVGGESRERAKSTFVELAQARRFGYHRSAAFPPSRPRSAVTTKPRLPAGAEVLLDGKHGATGSVPKTYKGKPVPEAGCRGEAKAGLTKGLPALDALKKFQPAGPLAVVGYVLQLRRRAVDELIRDGRYQDVIKRWSSCMRQKGYYYANPGAAMRDRRWTTPHPTREEIAVAVADTTCRLRLNYLGIVGALRAAYEQRVIDQNAAVLGVVRPHLDASLRNAEQVLRDAESRDREKR